MFPTVKPTKFIYEIDEILNYISSEFNSETTKKYFPELHKDNNFNKRFSAVLSNFSDVKSVTERLTNNIQASIKTERKIQQEGRVNVDKEDSFQSSNLISQNQTDLKSLYLYVKIFLDEYTNFLCWLLGWQVVRGIKDSSITEFYKSLKNYKEDDILILSFKDKCLESIKNINDNITIFRDKKIAHNRNKHREKTVWFLNEMNGNIKFSGGNNSLTPQEILFISLQYVDCSSSLCIDYFNNRIVPNK